MPEAHSACQSSDPAAPAHPPASPTREGRDNRAGRSHLRDALPFEAPGDRPSTRRSLRAHSENQSPGVGRVAAVILAIGVAPLGVWAADHLNSPTVSASGATDLTDVYAFSTSDAKTTVLDRQRQPRRRRPAELDDLLRDRRPVQHHGRHQRRCRPRRDLPASASPRAARRASRSGATGSCGAPARPVTRSSSAAAPSCGPASATIRSSSTSTRSRATSSAPTTAASCATPRRSTSSRASTSARSS